MTVRDMVRAIQVEVRGGDLPPDRAREVLNTLTSLMGNCLDELRDADMAYNITLLKHLDADEAANRAKIRAATTPEYARMREAKDTLTLVVEMIRSNKTILKSQQEEMGLTR
jgi:hypothetical protein